MITIKEGVELHWKDVTYSSADISLLPAQRTGQNIQSQEYQRCFQDATQITSLQKLFMLLSDCYV